MIVSKKSIGLIVLFLIPRFAIGQNSVDSIVAKQDSCMAIRTDSLCCSRSVCNCDTVQQDSCLQQHGLSLISKDQRGRGGMKQQLSRIRNTFAISTKIE